VVNPLDVVENYGADTLRLYEMFMGPLEASKPWSQAGVEGAKRFLDRIWRLYTDGNIKIEDKDNKNLENIYHTTVKKVTNDYETLSFNTAISALMIFVNAVYKETVFPKEYAVGFIKLLNPIAPHISEELYHEVLKMEDELAYSKWPEYDEEKTKSEEVTIGVQVNGKVRGEITIGVNDDEDTIKDIALNNENVKKFIDGKEIVKMIVIPGRIVNIVIR
jgi:leucyl-tRNA synthetase